MTHSVKSQTPDPPRMSAAATDRAPMVSVCIPTYNGKEHLAECIRSVRSQSFTDFEVVICDDQSSDGTFEFAQVLAEGDERFRFIKNPARLGLVPNWNNCVQQARGEWIKFVFQDDTIAPSCIEALLSAALRYEKPFAFCQREFLLEEGFDAYWFVRHRNRLFSDYSASPVVLPKTAIRIQAREPSHNLAGEPTSTLIHRSVFREIGDFDDLLIQLCDAEFWCRTMIRYGGVFVPESLASFRLHAKATTNFNREERAFRYKTLDELVMLYRFAFGAKFKPMRDSKTSGKTGLSFLLECAAAAASAWHQAGRMRNTSSGRAPADWRAVKARCPGLQTLVWLGVPIIALRRVKKKIKRRESA